ncbi:MAG TPA: NIL domain-containing protein [bacterium]|nr:NIL domain-containing protein [bacterium]
MVRKRLFISMEADLVKEPILYNLVKEHDLVPSVRRADVTREEAWIVLELQGGSEEHVQEGIDYLTGLGAAVKSLQGDVLES